MKGNRMSRKGTEEYIIGRECDEPMARSKGLLPCEKDCKNCMACIEIIETGERQHCNRHNGDLNRKFIQASDEVEAWVMNRPVPWSKEDEELLLKLHARGWTRKAMADRLSRTSASVSRKLLRLGAERNEQ
jgi:hypothetical protein